MRSVFISHGSSAGGDSHPLDTSVHISSGYRGQEIVHISLFTNARGAMGHHLLLLLGFWTKLME